MKDTYITKKQKQKIQAQVLYTTHSLDFPFLLQLLHGLMTKSIGSHF